MALDNYDWNNKLLLAPMVRIGTLPMRLTALDYGADVVYTDEIIDHKLLASHRTWNPRFGTWEHIAKGNTVAFASCPEDSPVVLQIGSADAVRATQAALKVARDVDAIGLNCGCPKSFSLQGGMGAALLRKPLVLTDILKSLVRNVPRPIECKIRLLATPAETIQLARMIEQTGVTALSVHGRTVEMRPKHPAIWPHIRHVVDALNIPVNANGDVSSVEDVVRVRQETGCAGVMIARGAMHNPSLFQAAKSNGPVLPVISCVEKYLRIFAQRSDNVANAKYAVLSMLQSAQKGEQGDAVKGTKDLRKICDVYGVADVYDRVMARPLIPRPDESDLGAEPVSRKRSLSPSVSAGDNDDKRTKINR